MSSTALILESASHKLLLELLKEKFVDSNVYRVFCVCVIACENGKFKSHASLRFTILEAVREAIRVFRLA
jgi:hypothetical protein